MSFELTKPLKILKRIQETNDAISLVLEIPPELKERFHYEAGQFITFFMNIDGEDIRRSYSLCSAPGVDNEFQVAIKKVTGGKGSNYLCEKIKEGDVLQATPPAGNFFKMPSTPEGRHYFLFAAGSGVTPIFSIIKRVLSAHSNSRVSMFYCNRDEDSIIFKKALGEWRDRYPSRLETAHVLGPAQEKLIQNFIKMSASTLPAEYYMCGPSGFMDLVRTTLLKVGVEKQKIHEESFGSPTPATGNKNPTWTYIGPDSDTAPPEKIMATIGGETFEVAYKEGLSILEMLLESGANPPYSCMAGACMACLAKVEQGQVYQEDPGILVDENIAKCESLTCQAKPLSRVVKISYDNL